MLSYTFSNVKRPEWITIYEAKLCFFFSLACIHRHMYAFPWTWRHVEKEVHNLPPKWKRNIAIRIELFCILYIQMKQTNSFNDETCVRIYFSRIFMYIKIGVLFFHILFGSRFAFSHCAKAELLVNDGRIESVQFFSCCEYVFLFGNEYKV